jgi:hypothetical protein
MDVIFFMERGTTRQNDDRFSGSFNHQAVLDLLQQGAQTVMKKFLE